MKEIKEVKVYICPETGKKCRSRAEAERSATAAIKAKEDVIIAAEQNKLAQESNLEKKDWVRLNATDVTDVAKLIEEKAKEFWGIESIIDINVTFGQVSNSHGAPIGKKTNWSRQNKDYPTSFFGWSGRIKGSLINYKSTKKHMESVGDILFNQYGTATGFRGFHTSSGCPGSIAGDNPMDIGFYFFLEDFPKLAESYELFKTEAQKIIDYKDKLNNQDVSCNCYIDSRQDIIDLKDQVCKLQIQIGELRNKHSRKYALDNPVEAPTIDPQFNTIKENFRSYYEYGELREFYE
jgi:hypothetical protein